MRSKMLSQHTFRLPGVSIRRLAASTCAEDHGDVLVLDGARALSRYADQIDELAHNALESNPFYEPWMLLPALDTVIPAKRLALVLVYSGKASTGRLVGFFPLERQRSYRGLPINSLRLLGHRYCFLRTPLVHRDAPRESVDRFLAWFANRSGASVLEFGCIPSRGTTRRQLAERARAAEQSLQTNGYDQYDRALFRPDSDAETYLKRALSGKRRKEFRRQERRLAECGRLEFRSPAAGEEETWIASFLEVERQGWKGRNGSAFASSPGGRRFFETTIREAFHRRQLMTLGLYLNGRPIALSCKLRAGQGAFAFKIAFDERYSRFSPGALLELKHIERLHEAPTIAWMDSCAAAEHFMANRLWTHKRGLETFVVTLGRIGGIVQGFLRASSRLADLRRLVARRLMSRRLRHAIRKRSL